jgi:hypothetical protein
VSPQDRDTIRERSSDSNKHITGKDWRLDSRLPVAPLPRRRAERQKSFEVFAFQFADYFLLESGARSNGIPTLFVEEAWVSCQ